MIEVDTHKKIQVNNVLITVLICALFSCITILYVTRNKSPSGVNQTQNVNINTSQSEKVDINKATFEELKSLNGIGDILAKRIINNRPYKSIWDLNRVEGIGTDTIKSLEGVIKVE